MQETTTQQNNNTNNKLLNNHLKNNITMSTVYETGHAKNVANLETIINFCIGYDTMYNPSKPTIKLNALNTLLTDCQAALSDVITKVTNFTINTNARQTIFADLKPLSTKLINALAASGASDKTISDAKAINRKIQGARSNKKTTPKNDENDISTPDENTISVSQQSYDQLVEHLAKLIALLEAEPFYMPNENELKVTTLKTLLDNMRTANLLVKKAYVELSNTRIKRNDLFYKKDTGLYDITQEIKKYIKSVFGATSPQYKQIGSIKFTQLRP